MADPRFFRVDGPFTLDQLATLAGATLEGGDPRRDVRDVAALEEAGADELTFLDNRRYLPAARTTRAAGCLIRPELAHELPAGVARLITPQPYHGYARIAAAFYPEAAGPGPDRPLPPATTAGAWVHPEAQLGAHCHVAPGAVVEAGAEIGARCGIGANAVIGRGVVLGDDGSVGPGATLACCVVGKRVVIHAGARIGQDGFGFALGAEHVKVPQLGRVLIEDDVEIGANTTIDRGSGPDTVIGRGCKIDNLVMIAHNVQLGPGCVIVAQSGVSGSTRIGAGSVLAAQVGVTGHLTIGPNVQLAARSAVIRDLPGDQAYGGAPAIPAAQWRRQLAAISRLGKRKGEA